MGKKPMGTAKDSGMAEITLWTQHGENSPDQYVNSGLNGSSIIFSVSAFEC